jgi:dTDP-4-dehydrorhamnose reductase
METNNVLVFGASGQLGQCIQKVERQEGSLGWNLVYLSQEGGDITDPEKIRELFNIYTPTYVVNCAAYTAVDKAEEEPEAAARINVAGVYNLADCCDVHHAVLIHISTDFVFDGTQSFPLKEEDPTNPLGVYGQTKLEG